MAERKQQQQQQQQHSFHTKLYRFVALICLPFVHNLLWSLNDPYRFAARNFRYRFSINMLSCVIGDQLTGLLFFFFFCTGRATTSFRRRCFPAHIKDVAAMQGRSVTLSACQYGQFLYNTIVAVL
jgi:hypothetical protein